MNGFHRWTFRAFTSDGGRSVIQDWYDVQSAGVRAAFDTALKHLRDQPPSNWVRPFIGTLGKKCEGLMEIRFTVEKVRHRPIGFFGPKRMEFTVLAFAVEKDRKFVPPTTCQIALERKELIVNDPERACEYTF